MEWCVVLTVKQRTENNLLLVHIKQITSLDHYPTVQLDPTSCTPTLHKALPIS